METSKQRWRIQANLKESRTVKQEQKQEMNAEEPFGKERNTVDPGKAWRTEVPSIRTPVNASPFFKKS